MTREEFKQFVLIEAKKLLDESNKSVDFEPIKPKRDINVSSSEVRELSENIKRIQKELDFRNPILSEPIIDEDNKLKESFSRMKRLYNFEIPNDENR